MVCAGNTATENRKTKENKRNLLMNSFLTINNFETKVEKKRVYKIFSWLININITVVVFTFIKDTEKKYPQKLGVKFCYREELFQS